MNFEFQVSPDISNQIATPPSIYWDPYTNSNVNFPELRVRNLVFELTVGLKFTHYDDVTDYDKEF
jgi:hypothetical protein